MDWFACASDIHRDPKIWRAAADLGVSVPTFVGHYTAVLGHLARHGDESGNLLDTPDAMLEHIAMWTGHAGSLSSIIRQHFQDADGTLHGWAKRNGVAIAQARRDAERKANERRAERERKAREREQQLVQGVSPQDSPQDIPQDWRQSGAGTHTQDVRDTQDVHDIPATTPTTTTSLPAPRKPRASRATSGEDEKTSWITPFENLWKKLGGPTSWDRGPALREFAAIRKHYAEDEILRRLAWYFENKGSEAVLPREQMERRNFVPHPRDFRLRFERFDPSAAADEREVQEAWARAVHDGWVAGVGQISPFRIRNELRHFVELYPDEKTAETALRTALRNYLDTCTRRVESPRWPEFASNIVGHLPPHLKLRPAEAA